MNTFELEYKNNFDIIHKTLTRAKELLLHSKNKGDELAGELVCQIAEAHFQAFEYIMDFNVTFLTENNLTQDQLDISMKEYKNRFSHLSLDNPLRIRAEQ
jgi:hypothetical protein